MYEVLISRRKARRLLNRVYSKRIAFEQWRFLQQMHNINDYGEVMVLDGCKIAHHKNKWYLRGYAEDQADIARNLKLINIRKWER